MSLAVEMQPARTLSPGLGYAVAAGLVAAATALALWLEAAVRVPNLSLLFVLPVVLSAIRFGTGPALSAAGLGVLAYNFFLLEPRHTLRVTDSGDVLALVLLLLVAVAVSAVAAQARRRTQEAVEAADRAAAVRELARDLMAERSPEGLARRCADALARMFHTRACVLLVDGDELRGGASDGEALAPADLDAARWAAAAGLATRGGAYPVGESSFDFWPLKTPLRRQAVLGVALSRLDAGRPLQPERLVETVLGYLGVALDREAYAAQAMANQVAVAGEQLKSDLVAAVSHDLRTPLSTILFTLQSLQRFGGQHDDQARAELLAGAEAETSRLAGMVDNLLDMNRVESGALGDRREACDAADLVETALTRAAGVLRGRTVLNRVAPGVTLQVDPALFETALANVLANAAKYAPEGDIEITAARADNEGWVEVSDRGPGFGRDPDALFARFVRGEAGDGRAPGTGLGLALARAFLRAMGGDATARNREDGGAAVRLTAPAP